MHGQQRRRGEHRLRVPLVAFDLVVEPQLFEEPEDALRAGVVEVMDDDHRFPRVIPYFAGWGMGGGGWLSMETQAERSKKRNSRALSCAVNGGPAQLPGMSPDGLPPACRSLNTALPQYCGGCSPPPSVGLSGMPPI